MTRHPKKVAGFLLTVIGGDIMGISIAALIILVIFILMVFILIGRTFSHSIHLRRGARKG
jgi:Na+-transporting methylmalonyl-CoA/oxaloacetate decarboxylase gamma subunit